MAGTAANKAKKPAPRAAAVPTDVRWTAKARETFLAALARTANVAGSAREAGVPDRSAHTLRKTDPAFAAAWDAAIEEGYERLELLLLRRATFGDQAGDDPAPATSSSFALALLKHRQTRARRGEPDLPRPMRGAALRDKLEAKLSEINRRLGGNG